VGWPSIQKGPGSTCDFDFNMVQKQSAFNRNRILNFDLHLQATCGRTYILGSGIYSISRANMPRCSMLKLCSLGVLNAFPAYSILPYDGFI
jgi:hypothetical protein